MSLRRQICGRPLFVYSAEADGVRCRGHLRSTMRSLGELVPPCPGSRGLQKASNLTLEVNDGSLLVGRRTAGATVRSKVTSSSTLFAMLRTIHLSRIPESPNLVEIPLQTEIIAVYLFQVR